MKTSRLFLMWLIATILAPVSAMATQATLSVEPFDIKAGETKDMVIDLSNPDDEITLVQFDLRLPEGLSVAMEDGEYAIDIVGRTTYKKHALDANATNGIIRFLLSSRKNSVLEGTSGAIISIRLAATNDFVSGTIRLENILLVAPDEKETKPADVECVVGKKSGDDNPAQTSAYLTVEPFSISAGETKDMMIDLTNPDDEITLIQFDLRLPEGLSVAMEDGEYVIDIAGRTTYKKHSLDANATNGIIRFLLSSTKNSVLEGTSGAVISISLTASGDYKGGNIQLENILLVTPDEKEVKPADLTVVPTGISTVVADSQKDAAVYSLSGQRLAAPKKGINIIGGKKVVVK